MNKLTVEDLKITLQMRLAEVDRRIQLGRQDRCHAENNDSRIFNTANSNSCCVGRIHWLVPGNQCS